MKSEGMKSEIGRKPEQMSSPSREWKVKPEWPFVLFLLTVIAFYLGLLLLMAGGNALAISGDEILRVLRDEHIQDALRLSFVTSTATALLSLLLAVPTGYLLSRFQFRGRTLLDALVDIPVLMPPLTVGLSLLIVFNQISVSACAGILACGFAIALGLALWQNGGGVLCLFLSGGLLLCGGGMIAGSSESLEQLLGGAGIPVTFHPVGVVLAQFPVAAAFAIRTMRTSFDQISPRFEEIAMSLGCHRARAFREIILPMSGKAMGAAGTMAWARALGEFGPVLIFAGAMRGKTEVLSTAVFLELNIGNLAGAAVLSLLMIVLAVLTLLAVRFMLGREGRR